MAQLIRVENTCDPHISDGKEVPGTTRLVGFDGVWYAVEACDPHDRKLIDPARSLATKQGRVVDKLNAPARRALLKAAGMDEGASISELPTAKEPPVVQPAQVAKSNNGSNNGSSHSTKPKGRPGVKSDKPRPHACLFGCDEKTATYTSTTALLLHQTAKHGLGKTMAEVFGLDCPLCGTYAEGGKLGVHLLRRHKGLTVTQAFAKARDTGDKHGIAARILGQKVA